MIEVIPSIIMPKKGLSVTGGLLALFFHYSIVSNAYEVGEKSSKRSLDNLVTIVDSTPNQRAFNFARMRAESLNGGVKNYHAQSCMHSRQASKKCLISEENGYTYRFLGGVPGWEPLKLPPSVETEIRVYSDGDTKAELIYNGFPR